MSAARDYEDIRALATERVKQSALRAVLVVPSETATLPAFMTAYRDGLIQPTIIGNESKLRRTAAEENIDLGDTKVIDIDQPAMAIEAACKMTEAGDADIIVQGRILREGLLRALAGSNVGFVPKGSTLSHVGVLKPGRYGRLLMVCDGLVHDEPDLKAKLALIDNVAAVGTSLGLGKPRVAIVTAVEAIYPQMAATLDGAVLAKMAARGQIKTAEVDGPLSFDIAIDPEAARSKGIVDSPVAGQADAILASARQVAAGICQAMSLFAECECGHVLVGGRGPVAFNFVGDSERSRYNSILLAVLNCRR